jgi:hypothetical protein
MATVVTRLTPAHLSNNIFVSGVRPSSSDSTDDCYASGQRALRSKTGSIAALQLLIGLEISSSKGAGPSSMTLSTRAVDGRLRHGGMAPPVASTSCRSGHHRQSDGTLFTAQLRSLRVTHGAPLASQVCNFPALFGSSYVSAPGPTSELLTEKKHGDADFGRIDIVPTSLGASASVRCVEGLFVSTASMCGRCLHRGTCRKL